MEGGGEECERSGQAVGIQRQRGRRRPRSTRFLSLLQLPGMLERAALGAQEVGARGRKLEQLSI